jgi:CRISPR-associated protein Cas2
MKIIVSYDVSTVDDGGKKRLRQVAKCCKNYGLRVQNSVFECVLNLTELELLRNQLCQIINKDTDSLRIYLLGNHWINKVEHYGTKEILDVTGSLIL